MVIYIEKLDLTIFVKFLRYKIHNYSVLTLSNDLSHIERPIDWFISLAKVLAKGSQVAISVRTHFGTSGR